VDASVLNFSSGTITAAALFNGEYSPKNDQVLKLVEPEVGAVAEPYSLVMTHCALTTPASKNKAAKND
jgi:hypothetical protein